METVVKKRIYILGAGIMQLPAIHSAKDLGWEVVCADANTSAPGIEYTDCFEHVDISSKAAIAESVMKWKQSSGLDGVFTAGTDFSACVAFAAEKAGLPGISYETALNATDKARMRRVFTAHNVPSPQFVEIDSAERRDAGLSFADFPLVVKPVDNMGARGIRRVDSSDEYYDAFESAITNSNSGRVIVEEYLEGPEFSIDALVYKGEITICGVADRIIKYPPYFIEIGHTMPSAYNRDQIEAVTDVFLQGVKAIGIDNGAAKGDIKLTSRGAVVGEIAARLSGGYMSGWTYPLSSGVNLTAAALKIAVGDDPGLLKPVKNEVSAERAFYSIPGEVSIVEGFDSNTGSAAFLASHTGAMVNFPRNNVEKCGNYIFTHTDRNVAVSLAEDACRRVIIRLKPGIKATLSFLKKKSFDWVPDAFIFSEAENIQWISDLPELPDFGKTDTDISIGTPPRLAMEKYTDWMGRSVKDSLDVVLRETGSTLVSGDGTAGALFWKAFLRGGIQGGIWYIDTLKIFKSEHSFKECFTSWS